MATGRGGSGGKALRAVLPADLHPRIIVGYYNGAYAVPLSVDIELNPPPADPDLEESFAWFEAHPDLFRSEEHTSELQSIMRISYAVFCLKKKKKKRI